MLYDCKCVIRRDAYPSQYSIIACTIAESACIVLCLLYGDAIIRQTEETATPVRRTPSKRVHAGTLLAHNHQKLLRSSYKRRTLMVIRPSVFAGMICRGGMFYGSSVSRPQEI